MIKRKLKEIIYFVLNRLPISKKNRASILMYHSIDHNGVFFTVSPENFEWQIEYLVREKYNVVLVEDVLDYFQNNQDLPNKTVALTFDDGYEDFYTNAFPILRKYNLRSTVFITTDFIGSKMNNSNNIPLKMLNWSQIEEMHTSGIVNFQPHGVKHLHLSDISFEEAQREIKMSCEVINSRLNKQCNIFCYPKGKYNKQAINILRENDFIAALTVNEGLVKNDIMHFELKRNSIDSSTTREQFIGKLGHSVDLFNTIFRK